MRLAPAVFPASRPGQKDREFCATQVCQDWDSARFPGLAACLAWSSWSKMPQHQRGLPIASLESQLPATQNQRQWRALKISALQSRGGDGFSPSSRARSLGWLWTALYITAARRWRR